MRGRKVTEVKASTTSDVHSKTTYQKQSFKSITKSKFVSDTRTDFRRENKRSKVLLEHTSEVSSTTDANTEIFYERLLSEVDGTTQQFHSTTYSKTVSDVSKFSKDGMNQFESIISECTTDLRLRVYSRNYLDIQVISEPENTCKTRLHSGNLIQTHSVLSAFSVPLAHGLYQTRKFEQANGTFWVNLGPGIPEMHTKAFCRGAQNEMFEVPDLTVIHRAVSTIVSSVAADLMTSTYKHYDSELPKGAN